MDGKRILGLTKEVTLVGANGKEHTCLARIDTGATSSSLDRQLAEELHLKPSQKLKLVKSAAGVEKRPLVNAKIKIDSQIIEEEFTLADRKHMTYQILIGQNILAKGNFLVDPRKGNTT